MKGLLLSRSGQPLASSSSLSSYVPLSPRSTAAHLLLLANTQPPSLLLQYLFMSDASGAQTAARG